MSLPFFKTEFDVWVFGSSSAKGGPFTALTTNRQLEFQLTPSYVGPNQCGGELKRDGQNKEGKIGGVPTSQILLLNCVSYMVRYIFSLSVHYLYRDIMLKTSYLYLSTVVNHLNCAVAVGTSCYIYIILYVWTKKKIISDAYFIAFGQLNTKKRNVFLLLN